MRKHKTLHLTARLSMLIFLAGVMLMTQNIDTAAQDTHAELAVSEAAKLIEERRGDPDFTILDVRTPEEFAQGHIAGARLVDFTAPDFADKIKGLPREKTYLVYCRSGNRSGKAAKLMRGAGFTQVINMDGGISQWEQEGLPVRKGE